MTKYNSDKGGKRLGVLDVILIVQVILKLFGLINWSWWAVLWPLWFFLVVVLFIFIGVLLCD